MSPAGLGFACIDGLRVSRGSETGRCSASTRPRRMPRASARAISLPRGIGAFIETMLRMGDPTQDEVDERYLTSCKVRGPLRLADLTKPLALSYGVDRSFSASREGDYDHSQVLAMKLFDAGFDGVWYPLRHDPASDLMGMAMFGEAASTDVSRFAEVNTGPVPHHVLDEARTRYGIRVIPGPRLLP